MVNGDILRRLFRSHALGDEPSFRDAALEIVREERLKNHHLLSDDLERILLHRPHSPNRKARSSEVPTDRERGLPLVDIEYPEKGFESMVLPASVMQRLERLSAEQRRADVLHAAGMQPTSRAIFYGPPGCGKTEAARALAAVLERPLLTIRFDSIVSSLLGETAANLRAVFEFVQKGSWVVLFDEFDAIGKERDDPREHGELARVVNALLQLMDAFKGSSLLIAATNHEGLLDRAIWRRFELVIRFPLPDAEQRIVLLRHFLRAFSPDADAIVSAASRMAAASGADLERLALDAARRAVLEGRRTILESDISFGLADWEERLRAWNRSPEQLDSTTASAVAGIHLPDALSSPRSGGASRKRSATTPTNRRSK